jgi:hypothetical protein
MSSSTKVLTGLVERHALEAAFNELAGISDLDLLVERAEHIAQYGSVALSVLLSRLDTSNPQLRGGLGQVAARLERDQVVPALRGVARSRSSGDQARMTAVTILNRFLNEPVDDALLAGLRDPEAIADQSLRELQHEMARNPFSVIEYLGQLADQPPDVAQLIVTAIPLSSPDPHLVTLLRMLAQDEDSSLARAAIDRLGRIRSADAIEALSSLIATLPPQRATQAERGVRKLRLSGVMSAASDAQQADGAWRALLSPIDGSGAQLAWFICSPDGQPRGRLISVLCRDPVGIVASFGSMEVEAEALPAAQPEGTLHTIAQSDDLPPISLLEVSSDLGRQVVHEALEQNWNTGHPTPMEYRLLNRAIWRLPFTPNPNPLPARASDDLPGQTAALLDHPAFSSWFWQSPELRAAGQQLSMRHATTSRGVRITELAEAQFQPEVLASYRRRLLGMVHWLTLALQPEAATMAYAAAVELESCPAPESPFIRRLIGIGLDVAAVSFQANRM